MEHRRRAILLIATALFVAGMAERRPLVTVALPSSDSLIHTPPVAQATIDMGMFGLSLLVRWNAKR